jgi:glycosyltransferase involved in cell wall biosynthesis
VSGETGLLIDVDDPRALAEAVVSLLDRPGMAARMALRPRAGGAALRLGQLRRRVRRALPAAGRDVMPPTS